MSGVVNPTLNIFNTVKLENLIACINTLILTALVFSKDLFVFNAAMFDIYELIVGGYMKLHVCCTMLYEQVICIKY